MKRFIILAICLVISGSFASYAQEIKNERVQAILAKKQQKDIYKAELEDAMHGFRMGAEYSMRRFGTIGAIPAIKHGFHYLAGYRFTKCWYVGGIAGIDITTPFTMTRTGYIDNTYNFSVQRNDKVYASIMADVRLYMNVNRASTFLYTNLGAEFSSIITPIAIFGLGVDIHTIKDQSVFLALGVGMGSWCSANSDTIFDTDKHGINYGKTDGFVFNLKLGYSF